MKTRKTGFLGVTISLAIGVLAACGGTTPGGGGDTIRASSYDQSCVVESDCAPVFEGTPGCCSVTCDNAAINKKDVAQYNADLASLRSSCTGIALCPAIACIPAHVACLAGSCAVVSGDAACGIPEAGPVDGGAPEGSAVEGSAGDGGTGEGGVVDGGPGTDGGVILGL